VARIWRLEELEPRVVLSASPLIGVGLDGISESSPVWVFNDAFLESSPWVSQAYDTVTNIETWAGGPALSLDANDWVTQLTQWTASNGDLMQQRAGTVMFRDINGQYPPGIYTAQWQGTGTILFGFDAQVISQTTGSDGTHYAQLLVTPTSAGIYVDIAATSVADPIRNMHVWMPDANGNAQIGQVWAPSDNFSPFTPAFLAELAPFDTLRFMDWMSTNFSTVVDWSDRRLLSDARQTGGDNGVSYEYMIELANELHEDMWINLPYLSNDNFNTQLATLIQGSLDPGLQVYVEWSNEIWNGQFLTSPWINSELLLPQNAGLDRYQFIAQQIGHDFSIWSTVFAGQSTELVRTVAYQAVDSSGLNEILSDLNGHFDAISTAAYVTLTNAQTATFTASTTGDDVLDDAFADLPATLADLKAVDALAVNYSVSLGRNIQFVTYEGGEQLSAFGQTVAYQQALYDAQVNPRIYDLYEDLITGFAADGGALFMHYSNISPNTKYGSFGALQYLGQPVSQAPKYQALLSAAAGAWSQPTSLPPMPTQLTATTVSNTVVDLSWQAHLGFESGFAIEASTDGVNFVQIAVAPARALTFTLTNLQLQTTYTFRVRAINNVGNSGYSNITSARTGSASGLTSVDFSDGFDNATDLLSLNGTSTTSGSTLILTDGGQYEAASAFTTSLVSVSTFTNSFNFQLLNPAGDGFTFTIQSSSPTALGGVGGNLGYGADDFPGGNPAIGNSVAIKFDLANNSGEGNNSTGLYLNGATPTNVGSIDLTSSGINLHSGDIFNVTMTYNGATLSVTITDTVTGAKATQQYTVSIGPSAYVGFTAGTGGMSATQEILNWTFTSGSNQSAPTVTGVYLAASSWDSSYFQYLDSNGLGNATVNGLGFAVFGGSYQLQTLPWLGLNTLNVLFSANVSVAEGSLTLIGSSDSDLPPLPAVSGFSYNSATYVATWTFASPLKYNRDLVSLAADSILGNTGLQLDGDSSGSPGGDFNVKFYVLPGDTANQQTVTLAEAKQIVPSINLSTGDVGYNYRKDVLGQGTITLADAKQIIQYINNDISSIDDPVVPTQSLVSVETADVETALTAAVDTQSTASIVKPASVVTNDVAESTVAASNTSQVAGVASLDTATMIYVASSVNSVSSLDVSIAAASDSADAETLAASILPSNSSSLFIAATMPGATPKVNPAKKFADSDDAAPTHSHDAVVDRIGRTASVLSCHSARSPLL
jgi:hypothetical protein